MVQNAADEEVANGNGSSAGAIKISLLALASRYGL